MAKPQLTSAILNELLDYNPTTGALTWKPRGIHWFKDSPRWPAEHHMRCFNTRFAGKPALNCLTEYGYLVGNLLGVVYFAHRVVWAMAHDEWPEQIDHESGNRSDNRLNNLRRATPTINRKNAARLSNNTSGVTGVSWHPHANAWRAVIGSRPRTHLGYFKSRDEAVAARKDAEQRFGYHANHGRP